MTSSRAVVAPNYFTTSTTKQKSELALPAPTVTSESKLKTSVRYCMHISPFTSSSKYNSKKSTKSTYSHKPLQHGFPLFHHDSPQELLDWTTSFLEPRDLFALGRVCQRLALHVSLDSPTWRSGFLRHFFGIDPESSVDPFGQIRLRRSEKTWKKEYVERCKLLE